MTNIDVIAMAREAGAIHIHKSPKEFALVGNEAIERFAELVASMVRADAIAEERKRQARSADTWVHATTWRGLTYEEAKEIYTCIHGYDSSKRIAQAIEAKLKEKNNGN